MNERRCFSDLKKAALFANGYHHYPPHLTHLPFMPMGHPAMMGLAMANHLGIRPDMNMMPDRRGNDLTSPRSVGSFRCELDSFVVCLGITLYFQCSQYHTKFVPCGLGVSEVPISKFSLNRTVEMSVYTSCASVVIMQIKFLLSLYLLK